MSDGDAWTRTLERDRESGLDMRFQLHNEDLRLRGETFHRRWKGKVTLTPEMLKLVHPLPDAYIDAVSRMRVSGSNG